MDVVENIALIQIANPPLNTFNYATRQQISAGIYSAIENPKIQIILLTGSDRVFSAGADIREFGNSVLTKEPNLQQLIALVENSPKPIVAVIQDLCIGGGLELALACHARIARRGARMSLPEVKLGLIPGAGGTQRLPRLVGLVKAYQIISTGEFFTANFVYDTRLLDSVIADDADCLTYAIAFAKQYLLKMANHPNVFKRVNSIRMPRNQDGVIYHLHQHRDKTPLDPVLKTAIITSLHAACSKTFQQALRLEQQLFMQLLKSTQSLRCREQFFLERLSAGSRKA